VRQSLAYLLEDGQIGGRADHAELALFLLKPSKELSSIMDLSGFRRSDNEQEGPR
jgi:hypothetical protein